MNITNHTIRRLQSSDIKAFDDLFDAYFSKVFHFVRSIVRNQEAAMDLAQDIFVKFWEQRERISIDGNIDTYIYVMAKNRAINYLKRKQIERTFIDDQEGVSVEEFDQESCYLARDTLSLIYSIVEQMPVQRQKVFKLSRYIGLTHQEIANKLNISTKTVENHINYALKEIKLKVK